MASKRCPLRTKAAAVAVAVAQAAGAATAPELCEVGAQGRRAAVAAELKFALCRCPRVVRCCDLKNIWSEWQPNYNTL